MGLSPERQAAFDEMGASCPLPLNAYEDKLPGGVKLFPREFVVGAAKDWGMSSQQLTLTTERLIFSQGRVFGKSQQVAFLSDIRDVSFHKSLMHKGELMIDTASGRMEGLPAINNGKEFRDKLLAMVGWARSN